MGVLTFQIVNPTDGTLTKAYNSFSDAHITNWIAAYQSAANMSVNGTATRVQVLDYIITQTVNSWVTATVQFNAANAAKTAVAAAPIIVIAP